MVRLCVQRGCDDGCIELTVLAHAQPSTSHMRASDVLRLCGPSIKSTINAGTG